MPDLHFMYRTFYFSLALILFCFLPRILTQAQEKKIYLSVGAEAGVMTGVFSEIFPASAAASVRLEIPMSEKWQLTAATGYTHIFSKDIGAFDGNFTPNFELNAAKFIPLKVGARYFILPKFYGSAELGSAFRLDTSPRVFFAYSPGLGYLFSEHFDLGLRFESWTNSPHVDINQFALRGAYRFGL
ncbi:MAG: hypothetical protein INR69_17165 [Mucilaginibacter polytrichastri]|nr:hypothetical protein [Mucilaginibacter polytrichastri]